MKFCPECGAPVQPGAKFCVNCGQALSAAAPPAVTRTRRRIPPGFAAVFAGVMVAGFAIAGFLLYRQQKDHVAADSAQSSPSNLPPGHPQVELPAKARDFISGLQAQAKNRPGDIALWNRLGGVALRASLFDPSYYRLAADAYGHVLQSDPDNLEALRGMGNVEYDRQKYDRAIAAYEHYLKRKPDDPDVQTDLGTMYLYTGNADQAILRYKKAISIRKDSFEPYLNMGVAYAALGDNGNARTSLKQAMKLAPDQDSRSRVTEILARIDSGALASRREASNQPSTINAPADSFEGQIESMVRGLPFAGPKVDSVKWSAKNKAIVLMNNFPMEAMPPFARDKFLSDLGSGIEQAKKNYHVNTPFELDIADAATGRVMQTVSK